MGKKKAEEAPAPAKPKTALSKRKPAAPAPAKEPEAPEAQGEPLSKKDQILSLYAGGITEVQDLAAITQSRPSYVAGVLQDMKLLPGYFDLYTTSANQMNVYSKFFAKRLGFKDEEVARQSVAHIDNLYRQFGLAQDRAGQHHALVMALTMFDRARWTGKQREADVYRRWLLDRLNEAAPPAGQSPEAEKKT
jgi:hypothetical protein